MRVIETYDPEPALYLGARLPACTLAEDDQGIRWLLTHSTSGLLADHWRRAAYAGAVGVLAVAATIDFIEHWLAATAEKFTSTATESGGRYHSWSGTLFDEPPGWMRLSAAEAQAALPPTPAGSDFVNLHVHTEYSSLDGLTRVDELIGEVSAHGAAAVGVTDHGTCAAHPELQKAALKAGINPVFGIEAYLADNAEQREILETVGGKDKTYWHLTLLAEDNQGLQNIWAASTEANRRGLSGKTPRMDWDTLARHADGVRASTGCLGGPISSAILAGNAEAAAGRLARLAEIFGDRLYVEIHAYGTDTQRAVNTELVRLARAHGLPLLAADDSHYPTRADAERHAVWIAGQTNKALGEDTGMFNDGAELHLHSADDMRKALSYLPTDVVEEALASTVAFGNTAEARITTRKSLPLYTKASTTTGALAADAAALRALAESGWSRVAGRPDQQRYRDRLERELSVITPQDFCGYFLVTADYVRWAKGQGILVGPGRGSGGGSLVAYLVGITEIDPVRYDLSFERFLTPDRTSLPDFDVDFPTSRKPSIMDFLATRFGPEHVVAIGTHGRLQSKAIVAELGRTLRAELPASSFKDLEEFSNFVKEAEAGTAGLAWEDLWAEHGDTLAHWRTGPYARLFDLADHLVGRLKSYGSHASGVVLSNDEPLTGLLPLRRAKTRTGEDQMVTAFDAHAIEDLGFVKYDFLFLKTLDTLQGTLDAVHERLGRRLDLYGFDGELDDPQVWDTICAGDVLGCFQIETPLGMQMCRDLQPRSLDDLADVVTLVRPGPRNSGLKDVYLQVRAGLASVQVPDPRLSGVLARTYGAMIYQEQVLAVCRIIAGYDDTEAEVVRKILGKKQIEAVDEAGRKFIARAVTGGMDRAAARTLWGQMAEFSKYGFNKTHAYAYAVVAYWMAFLKTHFPVQFYASLMSVAAANNKKDRIPGYVKDARRAGVPVLPPDVNTSGTGFTAVGGTVRYSVDSLKGIAGTAATKIIAGQPYTSVEDFAARSGVDKGVLRTLARAGALDTLEPHRAALVARLVAEATGAAKRCRFKDDTGPEEALPCGYDWDREPGKLNERTGKILPRKPPPKRCTTACRQYSPPAPVDPAEVAPYTGEEIGAIEADMFGFYLTCTPFDRVTDQMRAFSRDQAEEAASGAPGEFVVYALVDRVSPYLGAANGLPMGFLTLGTEGPDLPVVAYSKLWQTLDVVGLPNALVLAGVERGAKGLVLKSIEKI